MRRCTPRSWSRRWNLLAWGLPILAASFVVRTTTLRFEVAVLGLLAWAALDGLLFVLLRPLRRASLALESQLRPAARGLGLEAGGDVLWSLRLRSRRGLHAVLVAPRLPAGAVAVGLPAVGLRLRADDEQSLEFRFRVLQPGLLCTWGVLVTARSRWGLFQRTLLLIDVHELPAVVGLSDHTDPRVVRALKANVRQEASGRPAGRGLAGEFAELREARDGDTLQHVHWGASARSGRLVVREHHAARDVSLTVLLDASPDMTWGALEASAWAHASSFVAQLSLLGARAQVPLRLTAYDEAPELQHDTRGTLAGHRHLVAAMAALPTAVLVRRALSHGGLDDVRELAADVQREGPDRWRGFDRPARLEDLLDGATDDVEAWATLLARLAPRRLAALCDRCPTCGVQAFADEARCPACDAALSEGALPARAQCLTGLLAREARGGAGRQIVVVVSSLRGGEAHDDVVRLLQLARAPHRSVHVVTPSLAAFEEWRPTHPASLPKTDMVQPVLRDVERLSEVHRLEAFRDRLVRAGLDVHRLEDPASLNAAVARLLERELAVR